MKLSVNDSLHSRFLSHCIPYQLLKRFTGFIPMRSIADGHLQHSRIDSLSTSRSTTKKYRCDICEKTFSRSNTLITHKVSDNLV